MNKLIFLLGILLLCGEPFEIIQSISQKYIAGRKESGGGINYTIELVANKSSQKLMFENIIVDGNELKIKLKNKNQEIINHFEKGDTLIIFSAYHLNPGDLRNKKGQNASEIILKYKFKGKYDVQVVNPVNLENRHYK